jgi:hypothetical protein
VIFLFYFIIILARKIEINKENTSSLVREIAIQGSDRKIIK